MTDDNGKKYKVLSPSDVDHFLTHGFVRIEGCFTTEAAEKWTEDVWLRLGMSPTDKSTWTRERTNMPAHQSMKVRDFAPKAWDAICDVVGGEHKVTDKSKMWKDSFIVNLGTKENEGKHFPARDLDQWHVDGDFFIHFLDSPEQGLLVIPLYTDILPNGGGTWICSEGVSKIGKWLYDHPEGVDPRMNPVGVSEADRYEHLTFFNQTVQDCSPESFHEMTGKVGDVILLHPLMLHSASKNGLRNIRIITNPPVSLLEPFNFDRGTHEEEYSLVELKTIKDLGGMDKLRGWKITGERKEVDSPRVQMQAKMMEEENRRLKEKGREYLEKSKPEGEAVRLQPVAAA